MCLGPLQRVTQVPSTPSKINYATIPASETVEQLRNYTNIAISNIVAELNMQLQSKDFNGDRIVNLGDPVNQSDAATKEYVDLLIDELGAGRRVRSNLYEVTHFVLLNQLTVGTDLVNHVPCAVTAPLTLAMFCVKTAPTSGNAELDIQKSSNGGSSWVSVFPSGAGNQIVVPNGSTSVIFNTTFDSTNGTCARGDKFRIDVTSAGGATADFCVRLYAASRLGRIF